MNCGEGPVSDSSAVIPDFEQCAEPIVVHRQRGDGGGTGTEGINAASEKPLSSVLSGNHRYRAEAGALKM